MSKVLSVKGSGLRNDELRGYFNRLMAILIAFNALRGSRGQKLKAAHEAYVQALDGSSASKLSIREFDSPCDLAWRSLKAQVRADLLHHSETRRRAGEQIDGLLSPLGNPTNLNYDQAYGLIQRAISTLDGLDPQILVDAHIDDIFAHLHACYDKFVAAQASEMARRANRPKGAVREARLALLKAWSGYVPALEMIAEDEPEAQKAIDQINALVAESNAKIAQRKANDDDDENEKKSKAEGKTESPKAEDPVVDVEVIEED